MGPDDSLPATNFSNISAGANARQHNGNVINHFANSYSLRQRRSDETLRDDQRSPLLLEAAADGQTDRIDYLMRLGVNLEHCDEHGLTALHHAVLSGFEDTVQALLKAGANINAYAPQCPTPLCLAALKGRLNVCSLLLSRRARTSPAGEPGPSDLLRSALHCAVIGNDAACVQLLLDHGCDISAWANLSLRPIRHKSSSPARVALADGLQDFLRIEHHDYYLERFQPLHLAVMRHNCEVLETLLQAGASIESQGPPRTSVLAAQTALTPLLVAAICGNVETLQFLISRGADPKYAETNTNKTALMCAATHGHRDCLERLVAAGVDLNVQSSGRRTALSLAIAHKHEQAALLLIQRGAALDVLDALGATVLDFAVELGLEDVAHELARRGAVFGNRSRNSYTLIRLWNVYAGEFRAFGVFAHGVPMPAYATLSHRLATKEVTYDVIRGLPISEAKVTVASNNMSNSWNKVENFSRRCAALGITWAWTGSLCVSRSDKTEFAEARRHTFAWIAAAAKHFIYLDDTDSEDCWNFTTRTPNAFKQPWFLQEFLANPAESTLLFNKHWKRLGSRAANSAALGVVLGMRAEHVVDYKQACIAAKLSWCAQLKSPPVEDRVYAAANVLGVQLQHRYGEGEPQALRRLQEALIDSQDDESLFAWNPMLRGGMTDLNVSLADSDVISDLLATSLDDFAGCHDMRAEAGENRFSLRRGENGDILGVEIKLRGPQPAQSKVDVAFLLHCGLSRTLTPNTRLSLRLQRERGTQRWERLRPTHGIPGDASRDGRRSIFRTRADSRSYVIFLPR